MPNSPSLDKTLKVTEKSLHSVRINSIPGLDLSGILAMVDGLATIEGNDDLVLQLLKSFHEDTETSLEKIETHIELNQIEAARKIVHNIKGTSGILGAIKLHDAAVKFNFSLKKGLLNKIDYRHFKQKLIETRTLLSSL
jgi:HPt (histidine-containing phosphotransfer) domain-containing protein